MEERELKNKIEELGYRYNEWTEEYTKHYDDLYCTAYIEMEIDEEYKRDRGLIHSAYIRQDFIISEQKVIYQIQQAFNRLQEELKELE